ncbi:hypothetical protein M9458_047141, partial [Cirrhinus mrigala]
RAFQKHGKALAGRCHSYQVRERGHTVEARPRGYASSPRVLVDRVNRYATPLIRKKNMPLLQASKDAVLPNLGNTERSLQRDPIKAAAYKEEIHKLEVTGYTVKLSPEEVRKEGESWFLPHHLVQHNGNNHVVFNCSFQFQGQVLNDYLYIYRALATQYDPLGFIYPFATRAKLLVQRLWDKQQEWDDPNLPEDLLKS